MIPIKTVFEYFKKNNLPNIENFIIDIKNHNVDYENISYVFNPYYVLERVYNRKLRKEIIQKLININYDFKSSFPYKELENFPILKTIKENLEKEFNYYMFYIDKGKEFYTKDDLKVIFCKTKNKITPFAFRVGYDIIINYFNRNYYIILNPKYKKQFSLINVYNKLQKNDESWVIWDRNMVVKTRKDFFSITSKEEIIKIIKEFEIKY